MTDSGRTGREIYVTQTELAEQLELQECERQLEQVLRRLDQVGAGIAAIHVNAAIEQLKANQTRIIATSSCELAPQESAGFPIREVMH